MPIWLQAGSWRLVARGALVVGAHAAWLIKVLRTHLHTGLIVTIGFVSSFAVEQLE